MKQVLDYIHDFSNYLPVSIHTKPFWKVLGWVCNFQIYMLIVLIIAFRRYYCFMQIYQYATGKR